VYSWCWLGVWVLAGSGWYGCIEGVVGGDVVMSVCCGVKWLRAVVKV